MTSVEHGPEGGPTTRLDWSVIVPFFGSEATIERCVRSILAADGADHRTELLLVDNASPDASRARIEQFAGDERVTILRQEEPGAYAARNTALEVARGANIAFTDADCQVDSQWLKAAGRALAEPDVGAVIGHSEYPRESSMRLHLLGRYENAKAQFVVGLEPSYWFAYANNLAVRGELFERVGEFRTWRRAADSEWIHRMARDTGLRLAFEREMRIVHLEFLRARRRVERLRLYTGTNARIEGFRELTFGHRLKILANSLRGSR